LAEPETIHFGTLIFNPTMERRVAYVQSVGVFIRGGITGHEVAGEREKGGEKI
jgi:hypothetical protein